MQEQRCRRRLTFALAASFVLLAARAELSGQITSDQQQLLSRAMTKIAEATIRQRRFACDALISRTTYQDDSADFIKISEDNKKPSKLLIVRDRVHVEVGIFDGKQLFSWPDKSRFQFEDLHEMTESGASGSGEFGSFAISFLADSNRSSFRFLGIENWDVYKVARYDYEVPLERSHYLINTEGSERVALAYNGSIFVDTTNGALRRLLITVSAPPRASGLLKARVDTSYATNSNNSDPPLVPRKSTLTMLRSNATEAVYLASYKSCRLFSSDSTLSFGAASPEQSQAPLLGATMTDSSRLPWGLLIQSKPLTPVDVQTSAAGDSFDAVVLAPVKYQSHIVIPKGAILHGRLIEVKQEYLPRVSACLRIEFRTVEFDGQTFRISLASRAVLSHPTFGVGHETIPFDKVHPESDPRGDHIASICFFDTDRLRLDSHTVTHWRIW